MVAKPTRRGFITIDEELCKGCYLCQSVCPMDLISVSDRLNQKGYHPAQYNEARLDLEDHRCTGCALCALVCPDIAIEVYRG
jgi:2-oxoglutarate ferredoxin oxidoreductase subunit delta